MQDYRDIALPCEADDFDPYVKFGRDGLLFVKRQAINSLLKVTRYTEQEIKNLMRMYTSFAVQKKGMNLRKFNSFWT